MAHPLDDFVGAKPSTNDLRLNDPPLISEFVSMYGLKDGLKQFDTANQRWKVELERAINERLSGKEQVQTSAVQ